MPKIDIDMFDESPKVGDKVKVIGKVKFIDEETGEVEVSYDDASIIRKKKKRSDRDDDSDDDDDDDINFTRMPNEVEPESQSLDSALARYPFASTQ